MTQTDNQGTATLALCVTLLLLVGCSAADDSGGDTTMPPPQAAPEMLLGRFEHTGSASANGSDTTTQVAQVHVRVDGPPGGTRLTLLDPLGPADAGRTISLDTTAMNVPELAAFLVDGVEQTLRLELGFGNQISSHQGLEPEPDFFMDGDVAGLAPDAAGFEITRIEIELEELDFQTPGADPNGDGQWTDLAWRIHWRVFGRATP